MIKTKELFMEMNIKLTKEEVEFIKSNSNIVYDGINQWHHIPYYFKELEDGIFEFVFSKDLPDHVKKYHQELLNR